MAAVRPGLCGRRRDQPLAAAARQDSGPGRRAFWLWCVAEIDSASPNGGRRVKLRPDGSTRCRYARSQAGLACGGLASDHMACFGDSGPATVRGWPPAVHAIGKNNLGMERRRGTGGKNHGRMVEDFSYHRSRSLSRRLLRFVGARCPDVAVEQKAFCLH